MLISGVDPAIFIRTLLGISSAFMKTSEKFERDFMPLHHKGLTPEVIAEMENDFDFIIVGSGYAGSMVASRLAAVGCYRILLLEAGGVPSIDMLIPFLQPNINFTDNSWNFQTTPQRYSSFGLHGAKAKVLSGKTLGGSSVLDEGIYVPENEADFSRWAYQYGLYEWGSKGLEPYLFKIHDEQPQTIEKKVDIAFNEDPSDPSTENTKNLMSPENITRAIDDTEAIAKGNPLSFLWVSAGMAMGYPIISGVSSRMYEEGGFFIPNTMTHNGIKMTPVTQFLKNNPKLVIVTDVEVKRVYFDAGKTIVIGVDIADPKTGKTHRARTRREVVLSAGTIGSAKLLMQSGIGPVDHLDELKIPLIQHLPVGTQLKDRVSANLFIKMRPLFVEAFRRKLLEMNEVKRYFENGTGLFASSTMLGAAVLKTEQGLEPDIMIELKPVGILGDHELADRYNYMEETIKAIDPSDEVTKIGGLVISLTVLNPYSVGTMWLRNGSDSTADDTKIEPMINPSYLTDERDLITLVKGAEFMEAMMDTNYMRLLGAQLRYPKFRGCPSRTSGSSDDYWKCMLQHIATTGHHMTSTNAMLKVVEPNLKVRGIKRLRVIDESVFPEPVTGGLAASIMAIANKGAQMLIDDNQGGCFN